jgi:CDP-diacylglycerol--glycerol-3-phosphate 3-phosphatidyltransferase
VSALVPDPAGVPPQTARLMNLANGVTMLRLLLVPFFAAALLHEDGRSDHWRVLAWGIFAIASVTDRIDGDLARRRGLVTDFGKLADPIADKALIGTALIILSGLDLLPWWVTVVILTREVGVTLLRFWVIRHGVIPASRGGKLKTLLQAVGIGSYVLPLPSWLHWFAVVTMAAALVLTIVTGIDYVARAVRLRRASLRRRAAVPARPTTPTGVPTTTAAPTTPVTSPTDTATSSAVPPAPATTPPAAATAPLAASTAPVPPLPPVPPAPASAPDDRPLAMP